MDMGTQTEGDLTGGGSKTITLAFANGKITMDGQDVDLGTALKAVVDAAEGQEGDEQGQMEAGYNDTAEQQPKPTGAGRPMAGM